jgi:hypothetical protein
MDGRLLPLKRRAAIEPVIAQVGWHVAISPTAPATATNAESAF